MHHFLFNMSIQIYQNFKSNSYLQQRNIDILLTPMSFILLPQHQVTTSVIKNIQDTTPTPNKVFPENTYFPQANIKNIQFQLLKQTNADYKYMRIMAKNAQSNWSITANIKPSKSRQIVSINFSIINKEQLFWKITNVRSLPQLSFKINNILNNFNQILISISFNWNTGQVLIKLPTYSLNSFLTPAKSESLCQYVYNNHMRKYIWLVQFIMKQGNCQTANKNRIIENINRYCQMIHINSHFNESRVQTENQIIIKDRMKRDSIKRRVKNKVNYYQSFTPNQLYHYQNQLDRLVPKEESDFFLQEEQTKYICSKIGMPLQAKPKNPFENLMVLNYISVHNLCNLRLTKINNGGFSTIYQTDIKYEYVYSTQDHQSLNPNQQITSDQSIQHKKIIHKYVILKIEDENRSNSRNHHQITILKQIKNGSCIYLPKYYVVANKVNPYQKAIFMDYISSKNLNEFMRDYKSSVSLLTKLYLIYSIIQSLRYIRDYRIVHLDLKPNNVMIFFNMLIKLIDFGQSYHPDVCLKKHVPGYTLPYSSPEIFKKDPHIYTSKSDVFSLGVIIFQMLYRSFPYDIYEQTENVDEAMKEYLRKWYFTPQEYATYGEINAIKLLNLIISKCLSPNPSSRPQLDWIALLIRQCFQLMN